MIDAHVGLVMIDVHVGLVMIDVHARLVMIDVHAGLVMVDAHVGLVMHKSAHVAKQRKLHNKMKPCRRSLLLSYAACWKHAVCCVAATFNPKCSHTGRLHIVTPNTCCLSSEVNGVTSQLMCLLSCRNLRHRNLPELPLVSVHYQG